MSFGDSGIFYAKSAKQALVATSSTHSEMRALYALICDIIFIVHLCEELGRPISLPAVVLEDNSAVIALSRETNSQAKRCKHFLMMVHYIRQEVEAGLVLIKKVDTKDNLADMLTKVLTGPAFLDKAHSLLSSEQLQSI
jgi:hypothetical protein